MSAAVASHYRAMNKSQKKKTPSGTSSDVAHKNLFDLLGSDIDPPDSELPTEASTLLPTIEQQTFKLQALTLQAPSVYERLTSDWTYVVRKKNIPGVPKKVKWTSALLLHHVLPDADQEISPQKITPTSFHQFNSLPSELRLDIWNFTFPKGRVLAITNPEPAPVAFRVCRESRAEALAVYVAVDRRLYHEGCACNEPLHRLPGPQTAHLPAYFYFHPTLDTFLMDFDYRLDGFLGTDSEALERGQWLESFVNHNKEALKKVQNLEARNWVYADPLLVNAFFEEPIEDLIFPQICENIKKLTFRNEVLDGNAFRYLIPSGLTPDEEAYHTENHPLKSGDALVNAYKTWFKANSRSSSKEAFTKVPNQLPIITAHTTYRMPTRKEYERIWPVEETGCKYEEYLRLRRKTASKTYTFPGLPGVLFMPGALPPKAVMDRKWYDMKIEEECTKRLNWKE